SALGLPLLGCTAFDANNNCTAAVPMSVTTTEGATVPLQEGMVFDPSTGNPDGTGRSVFSSAGALNVIPSGRINTGASNFWALLPPPNFGGPFTSNTPGNYFVSKTQSSTRNIYTGKLDWN